MPIDPTVQQLAELAASASPTVALIAGALYLLKPGSLLYGLLKEKVQADMTHANAMEDLVKVLTKQNEALEKQGEALQEIRRGVGCYYHTPQPPPVAYWPKGQNKGSGRR